MSGKVMGRVWDLNLPAAQMLILLAMADHADHEGNNVFPSVGLIAWKTGYSDRQVQRIVKQLVDKGVLVEHGQSDKSTNMYSVNLIAGEIKSPYQSKKGVKMSPPVELSVDDKMSPQGCQDVTGGVTQLCQGGGDIAVSPEPSLNRPTNQEHNLKDSAPVGAIEQAINQLSMDDLPTAEQSTSRHAPDDTPQPQVAPSPSPQAKKLTEAKSIDALLKAYLDESGTIQPTIYGNKTIRGQALEMHRRGITPGHIQFFIQDLRSDDFWKGRQIRWDKVAGELIPWLRAKPRIKQTIEPEEPLLVWDENSPPSDYTGLDLEADLRALAATKDMSQWG